MATVPTNSIRFVKELYPRLKPSDKIVARYRASINELPPIVVAKGSVLVDGYHRWQAHLREGHETVEVEDLGDLTDTEIYKESITRNATHAFQLTDEDRADVARKLFSGMYVDLKIADRVKAIAELFKVDDDTVRNWTKDAREEETNKQKATAYSLWLDCITDSWVELGKLMDTTDKTVKGWVSEFSEASVFSEPPSSRQDFDVWRFPANPDNPDYFGAMPPQVVENLLWLYTEPGQIIVDPFVGSGTTIHVAKKMGRRVWASDLSSSKQYPNLPIHDHDIVTGWPAEAPKKADFILLDPPYWIQAKQRYSNSPNDLGNMSLDEFYNSWATILKHTSEHLNSDGHVTFITSPAEVKDQDTVVDLAFHMYRIAEDEGLKPQRRIIVTYTTQQANGQQVEWARRERRLLKLYRDLVVFKP